MTASTDYFTGLVTTEHQDKQKYIQTVSLSTQGYADQIALCSQSYDLYDLDNAVGAQLDAVGLWVGYSRFVALDHINDVYFSWGIPGVGWGQGIWWEFGDPDHAITEFSDDQYRKLLKLKIACNHFDGTLPTAINIIRMAVADDNCTVTATEGDMSVVFTITGPISDVMKMVILGGYPPLKPAGINVTYQFSE